MSEEKGGGELSLGASVSNTVFIYTYIHTYINVGLQNRRVATVTLNSARISINLTSRVDAKIPLQNVLESME